MPHDDLPLRPSAPAPVMTDAMTGSLRLYVARSTPNSVRAQHNLAIALALPSGTPLPVLETIDVFAQPKRAIVDGVVVTPTLIGIAGGKRLVLMGDLADHAHMQHTLEAFFDAGGSGA